MDGLQDYAFNPKGWAYLTGRQNREPQSIIRFRKDGRADSKLASQTLSLLLDSLEPWTREERNIAEVDRSDLGVVIGEFLPAGPAAINTSMTEKTKGLSDFDPLIHGAVPTFPANQVAIVTKKLSDIKCNLYVLYGEYEGGLRKIAQLPSDTPVQKRIVYYSEWTENVSKTQEKQKRAAYHAIISDFCQLCSEDDDKDNEDLSDSIRDNQNLTCQALWQQRTTPEAISDLALGIRAGALSDTPIDESLYRSFTIIFCHKHQKKTGNQDIHIDIRDAYNLAVKLLVHPHSIQELPSVNCNNSQLTGDEDGDEDWDDWNEDGDEMMDDAL
ncbi:hypothetical protein FSARC_13351 [Fusarium sarcochroum]|uniref:Uncharacterized protein n=1 Tax=Fusarium sarcochroum TaxID=1208366 RepID=A0A8H4T1V6_9HYPO|nr:hypothetical protein FSARC_13351 [Fusarium sarcochroum]